MDIITSLIDFILHIDEHLVEIINKFSFWTYGILFAIIFVETGVVVMPFLPGDSLLFAAGALSAQGALTLSGLLLVFFVAAVIGDTVNYHIGKALGTKVPESGLLGRLINREKMEAAQKFFNKHGGKTIVIARFIPFIRTFIPFVAGASRMHYGYFIFFNMFGALLWVLSVTLIGYFFGNIPFIKDNFSVIVISVIILSVIPAIWGTLKARSNSAKNKKLR